MEKWYKGQLYEWYEKEDTSKFEKWYKGKLVNFYFFSIGVIQKILQLSLTSNVFLKDVIEKVFRISLNCNTILSKTISILKSLIEAFNVFFEKTFLGIYECILRPNSNYYVQHQVYPHTYPPVLNYQAVDDETPDEDSTYIYIIPGGGPVEAYDLYNFQNVELTGTILKLELFFRSRYSGTNYESYIKPVIITYDWYFGDTVYINNTTYQDFSYTWEKNPYTGQNWTWEEINDLIAGIFSHALGEVLILRTTQVYLKITYTLPILQKILELTSTYTLFLNNRISKIMNIFLNFGVMLSRKILSIKNLIITSKSEIEKKIQKIIFVLTINSISLIKIIVSVLKKTFEITTQFRVSIEKEIVKVLNITSGLIIALKRLNEIIENLYISTETQMILSIKKFLFFIFDLTSICLKETKKILNIFGLSIINLIRTTKIKKLIEGLFEISKEFTRKLFLALSNSYEVSSSKIIKKLEEAMVSFLFIISKY
ncbi:MAG: hypothetical protein QW754_06515, partial [Thermoplasmata archaeon]